ncbi:DUF6531 domain-containing protein [Curtobacterium sp. MCLR17_032]|uniref:DUF6531 domain-containing protein n=1 Tax=Curtobacterium sp. MCLR17_032 TaxID=2175650 RepID=UPI000DA93F97|nr:DUF6531 domain-containing protein [Curtobacterium sp. MCLR17_032]WIE63071.1 DUF6531 domain-containing protein [Curtobacterium sp. MCLR17_032]
MGKIHGNDPTGYSYGDADGLKSAATGLANAISGQSGSRASYVTTASREFRGYFSQVFADNADVASRGASELVGALQSLSGFVEQLREAAKQEDDRRAKAKAWAARKKEREDNLFVAATHEVGTWFGADDDPKPPEPEPEPHRQADAVTVSGRTIPAGGGGGGGGTSSAVPADLRSFQSGIRSCDESLAGAVSTFRNALTDYESGCNPCWGTLNAQSLVTAVNDWLTANGQDAAWAGTVAAQFEAAGGGTGPATLSDASISAALAAAGIDATRDDLTIGPFSAMGTPPTNGFADDPVNTATGNFLEPETDLRFGGAAAALHVSRMYNSLDTRVGWFGIGWSSVLDVRLELGDEVASIVLEDGRQVDFPRDGDGWGRGVGEDLWLRREDAVLVVADNAGGRWTFTPAGLWLGTDRGPGTGVSVVRGADDRITRLEHELGRAVHVEYQDDRVASVSASDGRRVEYRYDDARRLVAAQDAVGTRRYRWDDAGLVDQVTAASGVVECVNMYDAQGRVVEQRTPFGRTVRFAYLQGRVTSVSDTDGTATNTWISDRKGRVVGIVDADGRRQSMSYDPHGNLVSVTERDGQTTVHGYDDHGRRVRTVTPEGADLTYGHDEQDRVTTVVTAAGGVVEYEYADASDRNPSIVVDPVGGRTELEWRGGTLVRCTDPTGVTVTFHHDRFGDVVGIEDADGAVARLERDDAGRVVEARTPLGHRTRYRYDATGLLTSREEPDGGVWRYEHGPGGRVTATVDPTGARTELRYGPHGQVVATTDPLGRVVTKDFDALGNVTTATLPDGAEWRFVHDALSRLGTVVDPSGGSWTREYDATGQVSATVDPTGVRTDTERARVDGIAVVRNAFEDVTVRTDELGRPLSVEHADTSAELTTYDAAGRPVELVDADGGLTVIERDRAGRVVAVTTPAGRTSRYEYDRCGRPVAAVDPAGARTTLTYDADSRITARTMPDGTVARTEYDAVGRVVRSQVPGVGTAEYRYDRVGRVVSARDSRFGQRSFRYDAAGQLTAAVNGLGGVTRYEYDERGRLVRTTDPLGGVTVRTYTQLDKVATSTDPLGRTTTATYDAAGRQLTQTDPDGRVLRWEHDAAGLEVAQYADDALLARIDRDPRSRTVTITDHTRGGDPVAHTLEYSRLGQLVRRSTDSRETRWSHDADGLRTAVYSPDGTVTRYDRDAVGRVSRLEHTAFGEVRYDHDPAGRLTGLRAGDRLQSWRYADGQLVEHTTTDADGSDVTRIERDPDGRILSVDGPTGRTGYGHDDGAQLVSAELVSAVGPDHRSDWVYDAAGRLVEERTDDRVRRFHHDAAGQLLRVEDGDESVTYEYDGRGQRTRELRSDGSTTDSLWDARGWLAATRKQGPDGSETINLTVDALGELAEVDGVSITWDTAAATPTLLAVGDAPVLRAPGGITGVGDAWTTAGWRSARAASEADPWQVLADVGGASLPAAVGLGADGTLQVAGLEWMGARAYDPTTRGFVSVDPLAPPAGAAWGGNPYSFAGNDPLHALDPLGLAPITDAELEAYAASEQGPLARAAAATGEWFKDNWEYVAGGAMVVGGGLLMATGVGGPVGMMLISAGADTIIQKATTGEVNWGQVAVSGAFGAVGGGFGAAIGKHFVGNAVEGAVENVANTVVSGQPVTPGSLLRNAAEGAATSAATGGVLNKVHLPHAIEKLGDDTPSPPNGQYVTDLVSAVRRKHILDGEVRGDGSFGGGHRHGTGFPGKSEFPASWSDGRIIHDISDVATDPNLEWVRQGKAGTTFIANGMRDGVAIRVVIRNDEIISGFPTNTPKNPQ